MRSDSDRRNRRGFSLMELMIVVVITGVLAAIAIPTFSGYVMKSRASEATQFLGVIKMKQESYRAEFYQYLPYAAGQNDPGAIATFIPGNGSVMTGQEAPFPDGTPFDVLGAKPDGLVRFGYGWAAGLPTEAEGVGLNADPYNLRSPYDHYFVAQALADLDDDGTICTFEVASFTKGVWFEPAKGWE